MQIETTNLKRVFELRNGDVILGHCSWELVTENELRPDGRYGYRRIHTIDRHEKRHAHDWHVDTTRFVLNDVVV